MNVQTAQFLLENTEDHYDIVNNASKYAKQTGKTFLLCKADGIINSENDNAKQVSKDYYKIVLETENELYSSLFDSESKCVLIEFRDTAYAQFFADTYFLYKDQVDIPEKYVYCGIFSVNGAIYFENYRCPRVEKGTTINDMFTAEEIENYMNGQIT